MVRSLGACIMELNDFYDGKLYHGKDAVANQIVLRIAVCNLHQEVVQAERSIPECTAILQDVKNRLACAP
jgi:hypothetical protein